MLLLHFLKNDALQMNHRKQFLRKKVQNQVRENNLQLNYQDRHILYFVLTCHEQIKIGDHYVKNKRTGFNNKSRIKEK